MKTAAKKTHGGARPGAGRPAVDGERRETHGITLCRRDWAALRAYGQGNASEGVRALLRGRKGCK